MVRSELISSMIIYDIGYRHICQKRLEDEHERMQKVIEHLPKRFVKKRTDS